MAAKDAWNFFDCKTFGDYMHAYLKRDVHQLADVFETFRKVALDGDQLDPVYYFTLPGLCLDSALKMTKAEIELIQDREMYEFAESAIRGGFTFVNKHHVQINADDCQEIPFDPSKSRSELMYIDANNL